MGLKPGEVVIDIQVYVSQLHWPKTLDVADDGTIYVTNGGDQTEPCVPEHPFHGGVLEIDGTLAASPGLQGLSKPHRHPLPEGPQQLLHQRARPRLLGDGGRAREARAPPPRRRHRLSLLRDHEYPLCQPRPGARLLQGRERVGVVLHRRYPLWYRVRPRRLARAVERPCLHAPPRRVRLVEGRADGRHRHRSRHGPRRPGHGPRWVTPPSR